MTGKEIAANLRANRERWGRNKYYDDGKYCVIGLKLHELGVKVEDWDESRQQLPVYHFGVSDLLELQRMNDRPESGLDDETVFAQLVAYCDANADKDYPIEVLAEHFMQEVQ